MNCEQAEIFMMKFFDGEFSELEYARFEKHLKCCEICSVNFVNMKEVLSTIETDAMIEPPEGFEAEVMARIGSIENVKREKGAKWLILLYNSAALISIALLAIFMSGLKEIDFVKTPRQIGACVASIGTLVRVMFHATMGMLNGIIDTVRILQQVGTAITQEHLYTIAALMLLILGMKNLYTAKAGQNGGN